MTTKTLHFCGACGIHLSGQEKSEEKCPNCDAPTSISIPGEFTVENADAMEQIMATSNVDVGPLT